MKREREVSARGGAASMESSRPPNQFTAEVAIRRPQFTLD